MIGLIHAGLMATFLHVVNTAILAHAPRGVFQLRGAWGEDSIRSELEHAKRKRLVRCWVDSIAVQAGDLDTWSSRARAGSPFWTPVPHRCDANRHR